MIAEEVEVAAAGAASELGVHINDFSVGAFFPEPGKPVGGHRYVVELSGIPPAGFAESFSRLADDTMQAGSKDYRAHRSDGFGMAAPEIWAVAPGTFADWMKSRGRLGGQNKVPRLINDEELFRNLCDFAEQRRL